MKKLKKSPITIACYVIAGLSMLYAVYSLYAAVSYLSNYFTAYGTSIAANLSDSMTYMLSQSFTPLCFAVMMFMCGHINDGVRALNPNNYVEIEIVEKVSAESDKTTEEEAVVLADTECAAKDSAVIDTEAVDEKETASESEA